MACEYIYIYKGDDTDWNDEQLITVNVTSGSPLVDLTDMTATFILGSYEKKNISLESGSFQIDLGAAVTGDFPYGAIMGVIKILDSQKRVRTVANMIPFYVTDEVITLQNQNLVIDVPQVSINLTVGGTVNYNNLSNKPSINGLTVEGAHDAAYYDLATKTALDAHIADVNNPHEVTKAQIGLGNVDNTADADKPISTATQSALNTKMPLAGGTFTGNVAFANGTKIEFPTFDIYNDDGLAIIEGTYGLRVDTTSGLGAVLKTVNGIEKILTDKDVKSTYSATGTDPVNGTAVASAISTKQDNLTPAQLAAVNSGIDSTKVAQIATNTTDISTINGKIPSQASSTNQLADKNFVNSSIATNTANFIGTFNSVAELEAYSGPLTNNDYAFVVGTDGEGNTVYDRYKYTTATTPASWVFEYELNNSSFTAAQWAAINSGATSTNIGQIATNTSDISSLQSNKLDATTAASTYLTQTSAASTYATQSALSTGLAAKQNVLSSAQQAAVDSGVTSDTVSQVGTNAQHISAITAELEAAKPWQKPSGWVDIRFGAQDNSIYALVGHKADFSKYNLFPIKARVNNSGTYDIYIDGVKKYSAVASDTTTTINWQTLNLASGFDVNYPEALKTHIIRLTPTVSTNQLTYPKFISSDISMDEGSGLLWLHFTVDYSMLIESMCHATGPRNSKILEAVTCSTDTLKCGWAAQAFLGAVSLKTVPVLECTIADTDYNNVFDYTKIKRLEIKNTVQIDRTRSQAQTDLPECEEIAITGTYPMNTTSFSNCPKLKRIVGNWNHTYWENYNNVFGGNVSMEDMFLDFSDGSQVKRMNIGGTNSVPLPWFKGLLVSASAPFDNTTSPQISVAYTGMNRGSLVSLFESLPYNVGYTVVGTPTIVDGVASGFSNNDYLDISDGYAWDFDKDFEFQAEFTPTSTDNAPILVGSNYYYGGLQIINGKIRFGCRKSESSGGGTYSLESTDSVVANSTYLVNAKRVGNTLTLTINKDGSPLETKTDDLTNIGFLQNEIWHIRIGYYSGGTFAGTVNLNNTFIKKNGVTFFNGAATRQLDPAATNVGGVTITNGVASGFDGNSKYITFPISGISQNTSFSVNTRLQLKSIGNISYETLTINNLFLFYYCWGSIRFMGRPSDSWVYYTEFSSSDITIAADTWYLWNVIYDGAGNLTTSISIDDGVTWVTKTASGITLPTVASSNVRFLSQQLKYVDLNNTKMTINNSTVFSGMVPMTKTCSVVGCTGTPSLTADDKAIATGKGWELTVA